MKTMKKRIWSVMCLLIAVCTLSVGTVLASEDNVKGDEEQTRIIFTHDLHSRLDEFKTKDGMAGGFARLKTQIDEEKGLNPRTFVLDAGDFSMGTLYQTIYETHAAELTMLGRLGIDATTFGNHEFDYRPEGVANMLYSSLKNKENDPSLSLPLFLIANINWDKNATEDNLLIKDALDQYGSTPYTVIERNGIKIGLYGVLGKEADSNAPKSGLIFDDIVDTSKEVVKELKQEGADLIVCLSHSGTNEDEKQSEDEILAIEVPEIDVIISGHTHTTLKDPIVHGDTTIVSCGNYGEKLGILDLVPDGNGRWKVKNYQLKKMDEEVPQDSQILNELESYKGYIDESYLNRFHYEADQVLAQNSVDFTEADKIGDKLKEEPLGNLIADAYIYSVKEAEGADYERVYAAVAPAGVIRDTLQQGEITVSDVFNISSLGIGPDRVPGYPLVSFYLTGKDLKTALEIDASISPMMPVAQLYPSGIKWEFNPNRMILNRVTEAYIADTDQNPGKEAYKENLEEIEDGHLYRTVAGLYSVQMLGAVEDLSKGLLKITPKDKDGTPIEDYEEHIIYGENNEELKEWSALAGYLESFEKNENGISEIPDRYAQTEGRKVENDSTNPVELVRNPNKFTVILGIVILIILLLIILVVRIMIKKYQKRKRR